MIPHWLIDFSRRFDLYGGKMGTKELTIPEFKEKLAEAFRDMAESERSTHRGSFDKAALERADVWERAAGLAMSLPATLRREADLASASAP